MRIKVTIGKKKNENWYIFIEMGMGIISTISISNTRKRTASKKNRREKGSRAVARGSNPHSNGDDFSRSFLERKFRIIITIKISKGMKNKIEKRINIISIL